MIIFLIPVVVILFALLNTTNKVKTGAISPTQIKTDNLPANMGIFGAWTEDARTLMGSRASGYATDFTAKNGAPALSFLSGGNLIGGFYSSGFYCYLYWNSVADPIFLFDNSVISFLKNMNIDVGKTVDGLDISEYITGWLLGAGAPTRQQNVKDCRKLITLDAGGVGTVYLTNDGLATGTAIFGVEPIIILTYKSTTTRTVPLRYEISGDFKTLTISGDASQDVAVLVMGAVA